MAVLERAFDSRFRPHWWNYVAQSLFAGASVFIALEALRQVNLVVAASLAATAFTVFTMPSSVTASTRNVVGGHLVGLLFGAAFTLVSVESPIAQDAVYAMTIVCAMFVMSVTNTEHPPAAGTALGVVIAGPSWRIALGVLVGVAVLAVIHRLLRPMLRDLIAAPGFGAERGDDQTERPVSAPVASEPRRGGGMVSFKKALLFGLIGWVVPFLTAWMLYPVHESNRPLFESIMPVVIAATVVILTLLYFRRVSHACLREGVFLGVVFFIVSFVLDLFMFSGGPMKMGFAEYLSDVGVTYLMIPLITIGMGAARAEAFHRSKAD
jgi:uncharacterized membrane protein (UPF0136 family)